MRATTMQVVSSSSSKMSSYRPNLVEVDEQKPTFPYVSIRLIITKSCWVSTFYYSRLLPKIVNGGIAGIIGVTCVFPIDLGLPF